MVFLHNKYHHCLASYTDSAWLVWSLLCKKIVRITPICFAVLNHTACTTPNS